MHLSPAPSNPIPLAIVLKGYPRLSETFIAQEILALEAHFDITIYSLRRPTDRQTHPVHQEIKANIVYLPEYLYQQPLRLIKSVFQVAGAALQSGVLSQWWRDFRRDPSANRIRRLGQAFVLAAELPEHIKKMYVHFAHTPASVTRYACMIRSLPWACSAHAKDIWTSPEWELQEKLADCQWLTTCTAANQIYLSNLADTPNKVKLNYHGLDLNRFSGQPRFSQNNGHSDETGESQNEPVHILSVGRAVAKKGYTHLLDALAQLPRTLNWRFFHIGGGPLLNDLKQKAQSLGIESRIEWLGPLPQQAVLDYYQSSDFFVLNCLIEENGDRDGLPNVLVEAQSQGLAVLSTRISGIPELVKENVNGLLVDPEDTPSLTQKLHLLINQPNERQRLGQAGYRIVHDHFDAIQNSQALSNLLKSL